tara:strand:- start:458 stop:1105 length:648 start_codon:yes stop_codon:yes gene_type:complete
MLPVGQTEESGAPNSQNSESRVLDVFGPNFLIETNGAVGVAGQLKYQMYSVTDDGVVYQQALYGSGLASINAEKTLEIQTGLKNKARDISFTLMTHHGDVAVNADNGMIRLKGRNIVIDATNQLSLQANKIQIGHVQPGKTQDFQVTSTRVDLGRPKRGNMCKVLKTCATTLSFAKSLTPFTSGGIGGIAGGLVGGAVGGPVGSQIGSQVGKKFL